MIGLSVIWSNIKSFVVPALLVAVVWFYQESKFQEKEKITQTENASQLRKYDTLRYASQVLAANELNDYLKYQNTDLNSKLKANNINLSRIQSIVSQTLKYRDTTKRETDVSGLVDAIKNSIPKEQTWSDTTNCLTVKGIISFDGQKLKNILTTREFKNKSDAVAYWERRQWSFLGIKTRLFGKKQFTSKVFDECGESRTMKIEKKK
jgi:hypothetical protein